ncbi:MAG TPA: cyanophycin synthetase, partial [Acidimicrobiales bacterium]|nr:cyanophycin synthetase [Acidimicrobiales bacterium]
TRFSWRGREVSLRLSGAFHVNNALAAATAATALGVDEDAVIEGLRLAEPVPGRFEIVETRTPFTIVVDYAHTPDALRAALAGAREFAATGRVLCVFGCGGERDVYKRPQMGSVAEKCADVVLITSDNPRSEDPMEIVTQIKSGLEHPDAAIVDPDRRAAIAKAVGLARPGDVVLIAGKGHETTIEQGGTTVAFDDRIEAAGAVKSLSDRPWRGQTS